MARLLLEPGEVEPTEIKVYLGSTLLGEVYRTYSKARGHWWWARRAEADPEDLPLGWFWDMPEAVRPLTDTAWLHRADHRMRPVRRHHS